MRAGAWPIKSTAVLPARSEEMNAPDTSLRPHLLSEGGRPCQHTGSHGVRGKLAGCLRHGPSQPGSVLLYWAIPHSQGPLRMAGSSLIHKGAVRSPWDSRHQNGGGGTRGGNRIQVLTKSLKARAGAHSALPSSPGACACWSLSPAGPCWPLCGLGHSCLFPDMWVRTLCSSVLCTPLRSVCGK